MLREKQIQVTHEQQQILNHDIQRDHVVKIMAFAGEYIVVQAIFVWLITSYSTHFVCVLAV